MKKSLSILLLIALVLPSFAADSEHYFGLYAEGAYSNMHVWTSSLKPTHGYGASVGALYEYEHNAFIMNFGCGFSWQTGGWMMPTTIRLDDSKAQDTQGKTYTLSTYIDRNDVIRRGYFTVPLLVGGQFNWLYMLGGVKVGIGLLDYSSMNATITSIGDYDRYFGPFHDQSNHAFRTDVPVSKPYRFDSKIDVKLSFEIGSWLGQIETEKVGVKARIALFADYGIFTSKVSETTTPIGDITNNHEFSTYELIPLVQSGGNRFVGSLLAGVKLTVLIGGSPDSGSRCRHCHVLDNNWHPIRHKKKCVICGD